MPTNVDVPAMGESVTEAVLVRWLKRSGDQVSADEPICELETDKANVDLPAPAAGVLEQVKKEGDTVQVGETIARIDPAGTPAAKPTPVQPRPEQGAPPKAEAPSARAPAAVSAAAGRPPAEVPLSPAVRRLVAEHQLDPAAISGTGPGGRITPEDVLAQVAQRPKGKEPAATERPATDEPRAAARPEADGLRRVPMSKIRRRIAERLVRAQHQAAMLTTFNEVDMTAVYDLRARYKEEFQQTHGVGLGLMSFFTRACAVALREFPMVNAEIDGDDVVYHDFVHLGIAVSTERGLVVPVLRHVEKMSFARIEAEIKRMANASRDGKLTLDELSGGTFTITNGGIFGSLLSTPILNPPQSAILGMHAIQKRPVAIADRVEVRPMMYVALSYDHRLIDGKDSVSFLVRIKKLIEDPARLMLEV